MQNVRANVKVLEFSAFLWFSLLLNFTCHTYKAPYNKSLQQARTLWLWHLWYIYKNKTNYPISISISDIVPLVFRGQNVTTWSPLVIVINILMSCQTGHNNIFWAFELPDRQRPDITHVGWLFHYDVTIEWPVKQLRNCDVTIEWRQKATWKVTCPEISNRSIAV